MNMEYRKGTTILREVEYTQSSQALPGKQPKNRKKPELWRIGKAGKELFLTDFISERSYVLHKGLDFNYNDKVQVVQIKDQAKNKWKVFWVNFCQETQQDVLQEAEFSLDFFDTKYITPDLYRLVGSDFLISLKMKSDIKDEFRNAKKQDPQEEEAAAEEEKVNGADKQSERENDDGKSLSQKADEVQLSSQRSIAVENVDEGGDGG